MRSDDLSDPGVEGPLARRNHNDLNKLWSLCLLWFALALAAGFGTTVFSGGWRTALVVLTVLLALLGLWLGLFAVLGSAISGLARRPLDGRRSLSELISWWIWASGSVTVGMLAGTSVYVDGPADLIAVPFALFAVGLALTRRGSMSSHGRRRMWACLALVGTSSLAVGLTIFL